MEQYLSPNSDGAGMSLPLSSLRLLVPPLRVMTAFMYQTLQQNSFMHYDKLDEFVAMVTELAPQLLSHREKIQLLLGLRAKFLLELCRGSTDGPTVQHYLDRMRSCCVSQSLSEMKHSDIEGSMSNFENTIYALLKDPVEKAYFFQEIYPVEYGSQYDTEVKDLLCKLISRLEQWISVPDREQVASWLTAVPGFFEKCLEFGTMDLKCLLQYSPCHKHWSPVTPTCLKEDSNSILNTLATPLPAIKVVVATEPVAYHIAPGATCMGMLDPGSLGDVVGETIIVTEYTEVELRTSDEGGTVPVEEMQTDDILPLVKEEMEVKMETSDAEEVESSVLVEHHQSAHVSEEVVTVLDWPMNLAQSVTPEMKDACALTVVEEDAGTSQQAPGGQEVDADPGQHEQHASLPCELVPGRVVLEQVSVAPQGAGTRDVRDVDVEDNSAPGTGESNDSQVGSTDKADKSSGDNIAPMKVDQPQNGKAASTGSPPEEGASVPQQECPGSSSVGQPCAAVTDPPHQEVHEVTEVTPQTVTPRRGRGRPRKSEQKSAKTPTSTPTGNPVVRQRGRRPSLKKEEEDAAVAIPVGSEKKTGQRELNDPEGKDDTAGTLVGAEAELAEQSTHNGAQEVPKASAGRYRTRRSSSSSSTTTTSSPTTPAPPPQSSSPPPSSSSTKEPHYRYTCGTCGRTFTRSSDVRRHQLTHTGERPFRCSHCAKTFQHAWDLSKHQRKYHGDGECLFRCGTCGADFPNLRQLAIHHKRSHTGVPLPHTCSICGKSFPAAAALGEHRRSHGDKPQYECPQCGQAFDTLLERSKHRQTHVAKRQFKCPQCDKTYTRRADVKRHQLTHTGERPHQCAQCGRCFGLRSALNKHQAVHTGARPFKCRQCGKRFTLLSILERHERMHSGERPFLCSQCGKRFLSLGELSKHYKSHTDERPFQCGQCGKRLKSKRALQEHTLSHRGERPYLCSYCGKGFTKPFALTRHHLMHTGERPYPCAHCGRAFLTSAELTLHERTHTGERPYACPECPMKFRSSSELARHKRNHGKEGGGGDQTHVCGICSKAFASMTKLNKHALTHAKEKGIVCVTLPVDADGMHGAANIVEGHSVVLTVTTTTQNSVDM